MHILLLTDGIYPFVLGGMQKHSAILTEELIRKGIKITLVHPGGDSYSAARLSEMFSDEVQDICIPFQDTSKIPGHYVRATKHYAKEIRKVIKAEDQFDLIYIQGFTGLYLGDVKIPKIVNLHGFEMFQETASVKSKIDAFLLRKLAFKAIKSADYVYSFGGKIDGLLNDLGISKDRILHQMNGISSDWITQKELPHSICKKFVFIGRQERRKGVEELNEALKLISVEELDLEFHFIGPIEAKNKLKFSFVHYHGSINNAEKIKAILDEMDCLVCPSFSEGMPTVIAEAMARGCAIIATDVGAISRQFCGNGLLLEKPEIEGIKKAIITLAKMEAEAFYALRELSLEKAQNEFQWEKIVTKKLHDFKVILNQIN